MTYHYTAITHNETGEIRHAEHFEDAAECQKRAKQLETEARRLGPWKCYEGTEPVEAFLARLNAPAIEGEAPEATAKRLDALAAKAGAKTVSVLTAPEVDDSEDARPLPPIELARSAVEVAAQAVLDAKSGAEALKRRADNLAEEAYSTSARSSEESVKAALRRKAVDAQAEADHAAARLYHAEQDLAAKVAAVKELEEAHA